MKFKTLLGGMISAALVGGNLIAANVTQTAVGIGDLTLVEEQVEMKVADAASYNHGGYNPGYNHGGYNPGYNHGGYNPGYNHGGYNPGYNHGGYNPGYNHGGYNPGYNHGGYNPGYNHGGYNPGYNHGGYHPHWSPSSTVSKNEELPAPKVELTTASL